MDDLAKEQAWTILKYKQKPLNQTKMMMMISKTIGDDDGESPWRNRSDDGSNSDPEETM